MFQLRVLECSQAMMQEGVCAKPFAYSKVKRWIKVLKRRSKCLEFSGWMLRRRDLHTQRNPFCRWYPALQMVLLSSQPCADQYRHLRKLPEARESLQRIRPRAPTLQVDSLQLSHPGSVGRTVPVAISQTGKISRLKQSIKCREGLASEMGDNLA